MSGVPKKTPDVHAFLPSETQAPALEQLTDALMPTESQITPIIWRQRREGVRINLVGEIGHDKPVSLGAVKHAVLRQLDDAPKTILIRSGGGSISEAFKVYEFLRALPTPLAAVADARCCSAAMIILMAADLRIASPGTLLLVHGTHVDTEIFPSHLNAKDLQRYVDDLKGDDDRVCDLLSARTGSDRDRFEAEMADESYMSEAAAVDLGVVHEWRGVDRPVDPTWPEAARQIQAANMILPPRLTSPNYFAACAASRHFPVIDE